MYLYVARHAWAGHYGDPGDWGDDSLRPLTTEGIERYRQVLKRLRSADMSPTVIATSPYTRCLQTAELIAEVCGGDLVELEALALGAELDELVAWSNEQNVDHVCWVGHNPDVQHLTASLVGDGYGSIRFAKGSVAAVRFYGDIEPGQGELYWHATAKLLGV
ncbi:SixA phosphatase family protein [Aeoliella mucimassa]|nr:histidine phosphatase family protein [Aeoliella mucimassa]